MPSTSRLASYQHGYRGVFKGPGVPASETLRAFDLFAGSVLFGFMPYTNVALAVVYSSPAGVRSTKLLQGFLVIAWHCFAVYTIVMARGLDEDAYTLLTIGQMIVFEVAFFTTPIVLFAHWLWRISSPYVRAVMAALNR
jgi:hypothetical protein